LEDKNNFGSLSGKTGTKEHFLTHLPPTGIDQLLRDLLGNYPSSDSSPFGGASVLESTFDTFDDALAVQSSLSPYATRKDWIACSQKNKKGKAKLIKEVSSSSSSLL